MSAIIDELRAMGHEPVPFETHEPVPRESDMLLVNGPHGSFVPVGRLYAELPRPRPKLVIWQKEQMWNPGIPAPLGRAVSHARAAFEQIAWYRDADGSWRLRAGTAALEAKAVRFRYFGELAWLERSGFTHTLATPSKWTTQFAVGNGLKAVTVYTGAVPGWSADLQLHRDIPVLWLGKPGSRRRARLLAELEAGLAARGVPLLVIDGVRNPYVFGDERTTLLNRTKVVVNLLRQAWDSNYLRYLLAMPNGALVVSEPTLEHGPFIPGDHLVHVEPQLMAAEIVRYLEDEPARAAIADRGHAFVRSEMMLRQALERLLDSAGC
jgi:hypothetical protein